MEACEGRCRIDYWCSGIHLGGERGSGCLTGVRKDDARQNMRRIPNLFQPNYYSVRNLHGVAVVP